MMYRLAAVLVMTEAALRLARAARERAFVRGVAEGMRTSLVVMVGVDE